MNEKLSLEFIHEVGLKNYDWSINRLDAVNLRIERLINWFTLINATAITIAFDKYNDNLDFTHWSFFLTIVLFIIFVGGLLILMRKGKITLIGSEDLFKEFREFNQKKYLEESTYWMGKHFTNNLKKINEIEIFSTYFKILFFIEVVSLLYWITQS